MAKKSNAYKHPDGIIGFPRGVLRSDAYRDLSTNARALMFELQDVWRPHQPDLHYSVRRAAKVLGLAAGTSGNAFKELVDHNFIRCVDESDWFNGKARVWRLSWLANKGREPTNEWMEWLKNKS